MSFRLVITPAGLGGEALETEYDLALLTENLADAIPEIFDLYLFGSRARGTKSSRSDADVLVVADKYIQSQRLREFSFENCKALDLFIVDGGKATSSQNESFIEAEDLPALLTLLGAVRIWSRSEGRTTANIDWRFKVREDVDFIPTALPNRVIQASRSSQPLDPSRLTLKQIFFSLTVPQAWALGGAVVVLLGACYWFGTKFG